MSRPFWIRPRFARFAAAALVASLTSVSLASVSRAQTLPTDFVTETIGGTFSQPTCIRFVNANDLLVCEKAGYIWDVRNGTKRTTPVIDLHLEILNNGDRGLLSIAADPNFATNGYLYLLYVVDPNGDGSDDEAESFGRLTRFTTSINANGDLIADPASRLVLIGATWSQGFPSLHLSHAPGDLHFASDGSLFISDGDGAHFDMTDPGGLDPNGFGAGKFDASEDIGAYRAQSMTSLAGKLLRIDPSNGNGLPNNPFFTGNPTDNQSRIWALGLRNPFRFCLVPGTGPIEQLYICNVGWDTWEAIFACHGGENFGWPCREGPFSQTSYETINLNGDCSDMSIFTPPFSAYNHNTLVPPYNPNFTGQCTSGACVYTGTEYPAQYQGRLFTLDYAQDWIRTLVVINGAATQNDGFATGLGHPVDIQPDPLNGDLIYVAISDNVVRRIRYTKADHPPVALATITPTFGVSPLDVSFDASASYDPEGGALTYDWDLGDGNHSNQAVLTHRYTAAQVYSVVLTVTDPATRTATLTQSISVDNSPPTIVSIDDPTPGSFYTVGQPVAFDATVADAEDDAAAIPLTVEWVVDLIHDHHIHPDWATLEGAHASYIPPVHGEGVYMHVTLNVTDSGGLTTSKDFVLYDINAKPEPHLVNVSTYTPRVGHSIQATGHIHYAGLGDADLRFDWGDGSSDSFRASHLQDCTPVHTYAAPGTYSLRFIASNTTDSETVLQPIDVRPLVPSVAIFAPLVAEHWIPIADQWTIATSLVDDLRNSGFDGQVFGAADQAALQAWMTDFLHDAPRDWLICLDDGASVAYAGQNHGSLAEQWLDAGNGIAWTGFNPFSRYITTDGVESHKGASLFALDELLNAATPQLVAGAGHMSLNSAAGDLPTLAPFDSSCALMTAKLNSDWTVAKLYASDGSNPPVSDALVVKNSKGGEYAQFYCVNDATLPREAVLRDFLLTHVFAHLPGGPKAFDLISPAPKAKLKHLQPTLTWAAGAGASSWLVEVATDATFDEPVFTATVERNGSMQPTMSVKLTSTLVSGQNYRWRVTARNDFGTVVSATRGFSIE